MTTAIVECPHCHYRFNYEFIPGASFHAMRLGKQRIFKCPNCKDLHKFNITHFGNDPSLPTHGDNAETGIGDKIWTTLLGPLFTLIAIGYVLLFLYNFQNPLVLIIPVVLGAVWITVYSVYLYRKAS